MTNYTSGLEADKYAIATQNLQAKIISTGSAVRDKGIITNITQTAPKVFQSQVDENVQTTKFKAIKIG